MATNNGKNGLVTYTVACRYRPGRYTYAEYLREAHAPTGFVRHADEITAVDILTGEVRPLKGEASTPILRAARISAKRFQIVPDEYWKICKQRRAEEQVERAKHKAERAGGGDASAT